MLAISNNRFSFAMITEQRSICCSDTLRATNAVLTGRIFPALLFSPLLLPWWEFC